MSTDVRAEGPVREHIQLSASSTWSKDGGYFCNINATYGTADMTVAADTLISGFMKIGFDPNNSAYSESTRILTVPSTTTDQFKFGFIPAQQLEYARLPVYGATLAATHGGAAVDIYVASSKQYVNLGASSTDLLIVLPPSPEDIADQMVRVIVNPAKIGR